MKVSSSYFFDTLAFFFSHTHTITYTIQALPHTKQWAARPESRILNKQLLTTNEVTDLAPGEELQPLVGPVKSQSGKKKTNVITE